MKLICLICICSLPLLSFSKTYKLSDVKFENFKTYEQYNTSSSDIKNLIVNFGKENKQVDEIALYELAGVLAKYYQDKGLVFHRVHVINSNPVRLRLIPGVMVNSNIRGNELYSNKQLEKYISPLIGKMVDSKKMKQAVLQMNRLPGLDGFAYLSVGKKPGEARINYKVNSEEPLELSSQLSNYGSTSTGLYRFNTSATFNNIFKLKEQWKLDASVSDDPSNYSFNSHTEFYGNHQFNWWLSGSFQNMQITQDFIGLDLSLTGTQQSFALGFNKKWLRSQNRSLSVQSSLGYSQQDLTNASGFTNLDIQFEEVPLDMSINFEKASAKQYGNFRISTKAGYLLNYQTPLALEEDYWGLTQINYAKAFSVFGSSIQQGLDVNFSLDAQIAFTDLPSHQRYSLSGPNRIASLVNGSVSSDNAVLSKASLKYFDLNFWKVNTVFELQAMAGKGLTGETQTQDLFALGALLDFDLGDFNTRTQVFSDENFEDLTLWFEMSYDILGGR